MQKKILITGASGFIGSFLVKESLKKNYMTFAGIRTQSSRQYLTDEEILFLELDFTDPLLLEAALIQFAKAYGRFEYIIHTAGLTKALKNEAFNKVNFDYTKLLVETLQRTGLVPDKFVYISSLAAYGPSANGAPVNSSTSKAPLTAYGKSKCSAEDYLYTLGDFPFLIINPTAVYGPRDKDFFFLIKSISHHLELYIGNAAQQLSFVHVADLVDAIFLAMESAAYQQNLLVSDLKIYTSREVNLLIKQKLQKKTLSIIVPAFIAFVVAAFAEGMGNLRGKVPLLNRERLKEFKAPNWSVDCAALTALGYRPKYDLEKGLQNTIAWYKEQGWLR